MIFTKKTLLSITLTITSLAAVNAEKPAPAAWKIGKPIVTYYAGPGFPNGAPLSDAAANQMKEGSWNMVWCHENELDIVGHHGLRGLLYSPILSPVSLDDPAKLEELNALIDRVKNKPAMYAYHIIDEPSATLFPALGRLVAHLRERDPAHFAYINLLPTYANNEQLGTPGDMIERYHEHLRQFVEVVRPSLISYDHYHFTKAGDNPDYFLNLAIIRDKAAEANLPFMNIVQASNWEPGSVASPASPRVPTPEEMRFLVYTTVAYGAQGISYYVYTFPNHEGGIALADGTPTALYEALKTLNPQFIAIAEALQPLAMQKVYHEGMQMPGTKPLPENSKFFFEPKIESVNYTHLNRVPGALISYFGETPTGETSHVVVVNLDYLEERVIGLTGPGPMEIFDAATGEWSPVGSRADLKLLGGEGRLLRLIKP